MKRLLLVAILTSGCGFHWSVVEPGDEKEALCISETARFAGMQGVSVRGQITDSLSSAQIAQVNSVGTPTAWYQAGVVYWYRPLIDDLAVEHTAGKETIANVACHEVCHAKNPLHDRAHWECMNKWATPTYPEPTS